MENDLRYFEYPYKPPIKKLLGLLYVSFVFFRWIYENNCPGSGVLARFFSPSGWGFTISLCRREGVRNSPSSNVIPRGFARGGIVRLGID